MLTSSSLDFKFQAEQLKAWREYVALRAAQLPEELQFTAPMRRNLQKMYRVFRERKVGKIRAEHFLDFLNDYAKFYKFEVPVEPELLIKQIHPCSGNLLHLDAFIELEDFEKILENLLVASNEQLQGQTLLASEICAFTYWTYRDPNLLGSMTLPAFAGFIRGLGVPLEAEADFPKEFSYALSQNKKFFPPDEKFDEKTLVPFDLFRYIYLERNL